MSGKPTVGGHNAEQATVMTSTPTLWNGPKTSCTCRSLHFSDQYFFSLTLFVLISKKSRIYVDTRLHHLLDLRIKKSFWEKGEFPRVAQNGSEAVVLTNPWVDGNKAAPFDQRQSPPSPPLLSRN